VNLKIQIVAYTFFVASLTGFFLFESRNTYSTVGEFELASSTPPTTKALINKITDANQKAKLLPPTDDMTCNCQFGTDTANTISYETAATCGPDRNYFADNIKAFRKLDPRGYFTGSRAYSAANDDILPKKCTTFILRKFFKDRAQTAEDKMNADIEWNKTAAADQIKEIKDISEYKNDPSLFAKCGAKPAGKMKSATKGNNEYVYEDVLFTPERFPHKPCVTEEYVNLVHNSLLDVADCMGLPAKMMAPKLSNESGMHINTLAPGNDAGIGQFTEPALHEVYDGFDRFKRNIDMTKESCRRIASIPGAIPDSKSEILPEDGQRCHVIDSPPNPLRSLIYYGIFYKAIRAQANSQWERKDIDALMKDINIQDFDKDAMKLENLILSYNTGSGPAATYMAEYLRYRKTTLKKFPVLKTDFSQNYWPQREHNAVAAGDDRAKLITGGVRPLTYAEYMFAYKNRKYLALVKSQAKLLDKSLGENTCTESNFLEL
jgi:hypothetical protein